MKNINVIATHILTLAATLRYVGDAKPLDPTDDNDMPSGPKIKVFDCNDPSTKYKAYSLLAPTDCKTPELAHRKPVNTTIQVLVQEGQEPVDVKTCSVLITRTITRCGFNSLTYGSTSPVKERRLPVAPDECVAMHMFRKFSLEGHELNDLGLNSINKATFFSKGGRDTAGNCRTADFTRDGTDYINSYEETELEVKLEQFTAKLQKDKQRIVFGPMHGNVYAPYRDQHLRSEPFGIAVWRREERACERSFGQIYLGTAEVFILDSGDGDRSYENALVIYDDQLNHQTGGFYLRGVTSRCHRRVFETQVPNIFVAVLDTPQNRMPNVNPRVTVDQQHELGVQAAYLHLRQHRNNAERFQTVARLICQNNEADIKDRLRELTTSTSDAAVAALVGPGYRVYGAGAVRYTAQCAEKIAVPSATENCTEELPIRLVEDGRRAYAHPLTNIIVSVPRIIPCSPIAKPMFKVNGNWLCQTPELEPCAAPAQFSADLKADFKLDDNEGRYVLGSLYSPYQRRLHEQFTETTTLREAVTTRLTHNSLLHRVDEKLGVPLAGHDFGALATGMQIDFFSSHFGISMNTVFKLITAYVVLQYIAGIVTRTWTVYKIHGFGKKLLSAVGTDFMHMALMPYTMVRNTLAEADRQRREEKRNRGMRERFAAWLRPNNDTKSSAPPPPENQVELQEYQGTSKAQLDSGTYSPHSGGRRRFHDTHSSHEPYQEASRLLHMIHPAGNHDEAADMSGRKRRNDDQR